MKKLFNLLMLAMVATLSFTTIAQVSAAEPVKGKLVSNAPGANVTWKLTSLEVEPGVYELAFEGKIKKGFHGYPINHDSAPLFFIGEDYDEVDKADISEPLADQIVDLHGDKVYQGAVTYVVRYNGKPGEVVKGSVLATICTDEGGSCTSADYNFEVSLGGADVEALAATTEASAATTEAPAATTEAPATTTEAPAEVVTTAEVETTAAEKTAESNDEIDVEEILFSLNSWTIKANLIDDKKYVVSFSTSVDEDNLESVRNTKFFVDDNEIALANNFKIQDVAVGPIEFKSVDIEKGESNKVVISAQANKLRRNYDVSIVRAPSKSNTELDWSSILAAILWGFAALLTPCVFPMVPMTVSFFVKGSQSPAQGRFRATMYGVFIVALYVLPIAVMIIMSNFAGGNATADVFNWLSTHWVPNLIFFLIFMVFAASFFGAFEITMPSKLVNKSDEGAEKGGLVGIFFMALTLVLVSFSCTGPIVGSVLISSASGGNVWMPIFTMAAFAIAFALPFTLLAWFPSLLKNMPKSGGWLNSVKVVLGFVEIALGLKFLMTADQTYHWGLLDREVYLAIWIVVFTMLGFYLLGKLRFAHDDKVEHVSVKRLAMAIAVFSFVVYLIPGMFGAPLKSISGYLPPMKTQDFRVDGTVENPNANKKYGSFLEIPHELEGYFDLDDAIEAAKEENKPIFVDVTGHGCNNCREMESKVWSNTRVMKYLEQDYIICALYVDDKTALAKEDYYTAASGEVQTELGLKNSNIALERWGVASQPAYVLVTPDGEAMLMPEFMGYETNIDKFVNFLQTGLDNMKNGVHYAKEAPGVLTSVEILDDNGNVIRVVKFDANGNILE